MAKIAKLDPLMNPALVLEGFKATDANSYDAKKIGASIQSIAKAGARLDVRLHATAWAIMERAAHHNDCSLAAPLLAAMPRGARREAMIAWFAAFSNVRVKFDKDAGVFKAGLCSVKAADHRDEAAREAGLKLAWDKPFHTPDEVKVDPKAFDDKAFASAVAALLRKAKAESATLSAEGKAALADLHELDAKLNPVKA